MHRMNEIPKQQIKSKNKYAQRCVQTLFAISPESKNILVEFGRSSDLLPYLNAFPKSVGSYQFSVFKTVYCLLFTEKTSGKSVVQYVFLFLLLLV